MGNLYKTVKPGDKPTQEQKRELKNAAARPVVFDDEAPRLTAEQLAQFAEAARMRNALEKKPVVAIRITPSTLEKAKATGKGYTGFLSRLLDLAIDDPELVKKSLLR